MGHITDHAAFGVYRARQDHRDRNQFTDFALTALDKVFNGIQQRVFQRLLSALRKRVVFFRDGFAAQIIERKGGVMTTKTYANRLKIAGFGNNRDGAAASGGGLLIDFFDQPALNELTVILSRWRSKLALFGYLNARDWPVLVNQTINRRAVKLFNEIDITDLSLSARCHTFTYSVTTSLPLTMVLIIL